MGNISDDIILIGASRDDWQPYCNEFTKKKVKMNKNEWEFNIDNLNCMDAYAVQKEYQLIR